MPQYAVARLVRCQTCSLVFAGDLPTSSELDDHYSRYPAAGELSALTVLRYNQLLDWLARFHDSGRLLDIGCGDGLFLVAAKERGWAAYGSEFGEGPRQRAMAHGLDVRDAPFPATPTELGSFDVVTATEVIEHVPDPRAEVDRIRTLLRPGGCLYMTTPNFDSLSRRLIGARWRIIDYPEHINLFTPRTLDRLLVSAGLTQLSMRTTGLSPSEIWSGLRPARWGNPSQPTRATFDERLRDGVSASQRLERGIRAANVVLSGLRAGDTIKAAYQR